MVSVDIRLEFNSEIPYAAALVASHFMPCTT